MRPRRPRPGCSRAWRASPRPPADRQVAVRRIVRRSLVREGIGIELALHHLRQDLRDIAEQADGHRRLRLVRRADDFQRLVERIGTPVEVARRQAFLDAVVLALDSQHRGTRHGRGERLRTAHAAEPGGQDPAAGKVAAVVLASHLDEGLVGALHDALAADVDPAAGGHLAEHHESLAIELAEMLPGRPGGDEVRVRDQHARRVRVRLEHADRFARLDQQRFIRFQFLQRATMAS